MAICAGCKKDGPHDDFWLRRHGKTEYCIECETAVLFRRRTSEFQQYSLECALSYASRGWKVLPINTPTIVGRSVVCSCGCASPRGGKHPRIRTDESLVAFATTDRATIEQWYKWWPNTNIGVVCSPETGIFGVDVDFSNDGDKSMPELEALLGPLVERTLVADTGNGYHMYFKHPGVDIPDFHNVLPGIDLRGKEAYLIAPPSIHACGAEYKWRNEKSELGELDKSAVDNLIALLERSAGYIYTPGVLVYPAPGQPIPPGWKPGLKGNVG